MFNLASKSAVAWKGTWDPASAVANTVTVDTLTVPGLATDMSVIAFDVPALSAEVGIGKVWVSAKDTLSIQLINPTAGALNASAVTVKVLASKVLG